MDKFRGRVAAVTGAGSGIGRALAVGLAKRGSALALTDIDAEQLAETGRLVIAAGGSCSTHVFDVSDREAVEGFAAEVIEQHRGIHLLVNNAGVTLIDSVAKSGYEDFEWLMGINFWGVVYGTKAFLPHMQEAAAGHIVNISSLFGLMAAPMQAAYNASKFAVRGFTEALRIELSGSPIKVSCVHPGGVKTRIVANARFGRDAVPMSREEFIDWFDAAAATTADTAASDIIRGIERNRARILIGRDAKLADKVVRIFPQSYEERLGLAGQVRKRRARADSK